jgi:hypothetical protein
MTKRLGLIVFSSVLGMLAVSQAPSAQVSVPLVFQTTFNCPDWDQGMGLTDANVCAVGDGILGSGAWTTQSGSKDQITALANNPGGGGGKGFRHWRGYTYNDNGGGIRIVPPVPLKKMWVRFYMRYQAGFAWQNGHPSGTKEHYWNVGQGSRAFYVGFGFGAFRLVADGHPYTSTFTWNDLNNGSVGDGKWHCIEYFTQADTNGTNGAAKIWVDGVQIMSATNINFHGGPWTDFHWGSNQDTQANGRDMYTDYDDLAISATGYIGPLNGSAPTAPTGPSAPANLRITN